MSDRFYGWENATMSPVCQEYPGIKDPRDLYAALKHVWCVETCAPRLREGWSADNPTHGQCSVTGFLVQDIFGGKVFGVPLKDGGFHCFNVVGGAAFDLTSGQFGDGTLKYADRSEQYREMHFASDEKRQRYELLKSRLEEYLRGKSR